MCITQYGTAPDGKSFNLITLHNRQGMQITVMDWGATWLSCKVPMKNQILREVLLGCTISDYPHQNAYLGASIGRYANRIANAKFHLHNRLIQLVSNQIPHQLHGGKKGFDKRRWQVEKYGQNFVSFSLFSPDGEQGYNGNLHASVDYVLSEDNALIICYYAHCDQDTALNLTNHAYFNLIDAENGSDIRTTHYLTLNSDYYLPVASDGIPNQPLKCVENTSFDFRHSKLIGQNFLQGDQQLTNGYDHSFLLTTHCGKNPINLTACDHSLRLEMHTNQPAVQLYTGNYLAGTPNRHNSIYTNYAGIALETQCLPDSPNHPEWQHLGGIVRAHQQYTNWTKFQFFAH